MNYQNNYDVFMINKLLNINIIDNLFLNTFN